MVSEISSKNRITIIILLILISLHLILISTRRIYPFIDIPFRLAASTILKYYEEPNNQFDDYYSIKISLRPNIIHLFFCNSKIFPSVEFANKIFYCIYIILLPLSIFLIIKKLNGNPIFTFFSFLILYNFNVAWGFSEFTIAIPLTILLFYFILEYLDKDDKWIKFLLMVLFLLIFFSHVLAAFFSLFFFYVLCLFYYKNSITTFFKKIIITIPVIIIILLWWILGEKGIEYDTLDYLCYYYKNYWFQKFFIRAGIFYIENYSLDKSLFGKIISFIISLIIITPFLIWLISNRNKSHIEKNNMTMALYLFITCALFFFLFLPDRIPGAYFLYQRFAIFIFSGIIILCSIIYKKKINRSKIFILFSFCLIHFIICANYFIGFEKENQFFTKDIFPDQIKDTKLAGLIYNCEYKGRLVYLHFPNYFIVWKHGTALTRLVDFRFGTVVRKLDQKTFPHANEWVGYFNNYNGEFIDIDYILVKGEVPDKDKKYFKNFKEIKSKSDWLLYERIDKTD